MILRFKTKRNTNGHRKYIAIDTDLKTYCNTSPRMIMEGIEITSRAYNEITTILLQENYIHSEKHF